MNKVYFGDQYIVKTLRNGLRVVLAPRQDFGSASAGIVFSVGSFDSGGVIEYDGRRVVVPQGSAHFLEHRMFDFKDGPVFDLFSQMGAMSNAFTSYDKTSYYFIGAKDLLPALNLLLDFTFHFDVSERSVENEKGIIVEELRMYQDDPETAFQMAMFANLYHSHPLRNDIGGDEAAVRNTTKTELDLIHSYFYRPRCATLYVTGRFDAALVLAMLAKFPFPELKDAKFTPIEYHEPREVVTAHSEKRVALQVPLAGIGVKMAPFGAKSFVKDCYTLSVYLDLLFDNLSPLTTQLLEEGIIADDLEVSLLTLSDAVTFQVLGQTSVPEKLVERLRQALENPRIYLAPRRILPAIRSNQGTLISKANTPSSLLNFLMMNTPTRAMPRSLIPFGDYPQLGRINHSKLMAMARSIDLACSTSVIFRGRE